MKIHRLLIDLKGKSRSRQKEFKKIVSALRLMKPHEVEDLISDLDEEIFSTIDCLDCGNCCRTLGPRLTGRDIKKLASELRMKPGAFINTYLKLDEDEDHVFKTMPCPFLGDDNLCSVYSIRPRACEDYPYTSGRDARTKVGLLIKNSETCPAVYLMLEELRKRKF